jgi:hypothetical protein
MSLVELEHLPCNLICITVYLFTFFKMYPRIGLFEKLPYLRIRILPIPIPVSVLHSQSLLPAYYL